MHRRLAAFSLLTLSACATESSTDTASAPRGAVPEVEATAPVLRRLTYSQYVHTIDDLFGEGLVLPNALEPDTRVSGLYAVGSSVTSLSSLGVERYESAAFTIAEQVLADPARHDALVPCTPVASVDPDCSRQVFAALGPKAWRRPLTDEELTGLTTLADGAASTLGDFDDGLSFGLAALLQSPYFLFRPELGEEDGAGGRRYTSYELASRLSYFLWEGPPDDTLLAAAASGTLLTDAGLAEQVDRMLSDDKARRGTRAFFTDMLELDELDSLTKDPNIYLYMSSELGPAAREQTLLDAESIVIDDDTDFRTFLTSTNTHLDRTLAALYDVPAPAREGFGEATLASAQGRRGYLGQASFLALQAHATSTSVTKRGKFIREVLLCQTLPTPPAGLNTAIPEASEELVTMRDRVGQHLSDPSCAGCHAAMDPIGLGLENFDGVGRWRTAESGETIDASGELDGTSFSDAWDLAKVVSEHGSFTPCVNLTLLQFALGREPTDAEAELVDWHEAGFTEAGYRLRWLMKDIALGPAFRRVAEVQ